MITVMMVWVLGVKNHDNPYINVNIRLPAIIMPSFQRTNMIG